MSNEVKLPDQISIAGKCNCGADVCKLTQLSIGRYYQGTGFSPEEAGEIVRRWNCHAALLTALEAHEAYLSHAVVHWSLSYGTRTELTKQRDALRAAIAKVKGVPRD